MKKGYCPFKQELDECWKSCALYFSGPSNKAGCVFEHLHTALFSINESLMDIAHSLEELGERAEDKEIVNEGDSF